MSRYQSMIDRVGVLLSASINSMLSQLEEANSLAVVDEYLNRRQDTLNDLAMSEGVERGLARTLARQIEGLQAEATALDREVDFLLARGQRALAAGRQAVLNQKTGSLDVLQASFSECEQEVLRLSESREMLAAQIDLARAKRAQLAVTINRRQATAARRRAISAPGPSTPDLTRIEVINEVEQRKLEQELGQLDVVQRVALSSSGLLLNSPQIEMQLDARDTKRLPAPSPEPPGRPANTARGRRAKPSTSQRASAETADDGGQQR